MRNYIFSLKKGTTFFMGSISCELEIVISWSSLEVTYFIFILRKSQKSQWVVIIYYIFLSISPMDSSVHLRAEEASYCMKTKIFSSVVHNLFSTGQVWNKAFIVKTVLWFGNIINQQFLSSSYLFWYVFIIKNYF